MPGFVSADHPRVKCENCGASMELNADRGCWDCPYCASEWAPQTNFEGVRILQASTIDCPICKSATLQVVQTFSCNLKVPNLSFDTEDF